MALKYGLGMAVNGWSPGWRARLPGGEAMLPEGGEADQGFARPVML